jgi:Protein of unknown function (DUF4238)
MPIRSHKVPKAYLKQFATSPNKGQRYGKLCVYERGKKPRTGTPKSEAAERGFFTARDSRGQLEDSSPESWAQKIEDRALTTLIYAGSPVFVWNRDNRRQMAEYWALMFLRSTSFYDFHKYHSEEVFGAQMRRLNADAEFRRRVVSHYSSLFGRSFEEEDLLGTVGKALATLLTPDEMRSQYVQHLKRRVQIFSDILIKKTWQVWEAPDGCEFVTCDSPVMTLRLDEWGRYTVGEGFGKDGSIIILPLSPRACLLAGVTGLQAQYTDCDNVHELNKIIVSSSARFVYSRTHKSHIDALVQHFGGMIRYGANAFMRPESNEVRDLFF